MNQDGKPGKRIFITGGASGLGLAIAFSYARRGWRVCIGDIADQRGAEARTELSKIAPEAIYLHCDVTVEEDVQKVADELLRRWGGVDVVVNNAGVACAGFIDEIPLADWQWVFNINVFGVVRGCRTFTRLFKQQGYGYLVNVSSMAGLVDYPTLSAYNAAKAAVVSLSETMQIELAGTGIGISVVCPSFFKTNLAETMRSTDPRMVRALNKHFERSAVTAEDVAEQTYHAQQHGRFYVLPHREGRRAWYLKRILPRSIYASIFIAQSRSNRRSRA